MILHTIVLLSRHQSASPVRQSTALTSLSRTIGGFNTLRGLPRNVDVT